MPLVSRSQLSFESGGKQIRMDCYLPSPRTTDDLPAVIGLHGSGGNAEGMSDSASLLAGQLCRAQIRTISIEPGRLAPWIRQPSCATSLRGQRRFGMQSASSLSNQRLIGNTLACSAFLWVLISALSVAAIDIRIQAVVEYFGGFPKELKLFMRRLCPVLILHGDADATVPVEEAYYLQKILENKQIPYEMKIYPGADHSFNYDVRHNLRARTLAFLRKHLIDQQS